MTEEERKALLEAELEHADLYKKNRPKQLEKLRQEFPDVPVEQVLKKYGYRGSAISGDTGTPKSRPKERPAF